jgi:hypothetical protein
MASAHWKHPASKNILVTSYLIEISWADFYFFVFKFFERRHAFPQFVGAHGYAFADSFESFLIHPPPHQFVFTCSLEQSQAMGATLFPVHIYTWEFGSQTRTPQSQLTAPPRSRHSMAITKQAPLCAPTNLPWK